MYVVIGSDVSHKYYWLINQIYYYTYKSGSGNISNLD